MKRAARSTQSESAAFDGWTLLTPNRIELGHYYLHIMRQMNRATYSPRNPDREVRRMTREPCEYFYYCGSLFELVLGFKWLKRLRQYRVMSTGFVGLISPGEALDRIAAKMRAFANGRRVQRLVAVRPRVMDNPRILQLYELLCHHPALMIRGGHHLSEGEYLWIGFRE